MTAEIAVMNKQAIALAADSAVTFGRETEQKIFTSASKIFTLSKYEPVGLMIYGDANLMEVPWETIVKVYRNTLDQKTFPTVGDYATDFFSFVAEKEQLFSDDEQNSYVEHYIYSYFRLIANEITEHVEQIMKENKEIGDTGTRKITSLTIKDHFEKWKEAELSCSIPEDFTGALRQKYKNLISNAKKEIFENLPLTQSSSRQLTEIAVNLFTKFPTGISPPNTSGIVIAGFGTEDTFPVLESFSVEVKIGNYLKYRKNEEECASIGFETSAVIRPFAQREMVLTFMTGVAPDYQRTIITDMNDLCIFYPQVLVDNIDCLNQEDKENLKQQLKEVGQKEFEKYRKKLSEYRIDNFINPVMEVVQGLPKDELAAMAESLINLTSFKRRVSMEEETVAEPIDVAVISKGDGFIWIKRKHYFERELNQQFFENYYKEANTNDTKTTEKAD
ncbi:MAG: hypothetical protein OXI61_07875 [Candidatus Poribacteria bacterium]|nr:hypothetical protein [Candidatus Poribacteria bacterium]